MKKMISLFLVLCLSLWVASAMAEPMTDTQAKLIDIVKSALDREELTYEYNESDQTFTLSFDLNCALGSADVTIFTYDDMVSVVVDSPLKVKPELFEKAAVFAALANCDMYYAQFRIDKESGWLSCRSCNVIESVRPSEDEIATLLDVALFGMEDFGDGIAAVCTMGADPYDAYVPRED